MEARAAPEDDDRDWRLTGELLDQQGHRALHSFVERLRDPSVLGDVRAAVAEDVVITHDGSRLFAYASGRRAIERARVTIEAVLARDALRATLALSHFSGDLDEWVDPDAPTAGSGAAAVAGPSTQQTRTIVATVGRMIREEFEQSMRGWADQLGLRCEIVEHPHLLSSQVAFTVTGPRRKLDEFAAGLGAEERQTIRTEQAVMLSPL
ncbi:MAG: hypothetical protein QOK19_929 [Solirubrobacteraceae bacterium]|jgi:hypothetical protein|nr:hypothetical protein [Solirubrobacteraceae bacterium]